MTPPHLVLMRPRDQREVYGRARMAGRSQRLSPSAVPVAPRAPELHEQFVHLPPRVSKLLLVVGAAVWLISAAVTAITGDDILVRSRCRAGEQPRTTRSALQRLT